MKNQIKQVQGENINEGELNRNLVKLSAIGPLFGLK
jgi:hypothetical protein